MRGTTLKRTSRSGLTLVEALMGLAALGILAVVIAGVSGDYFRGSAQLIQNSEVNDIQDVLVRRISCEQTMPACTSDGFISIKDKNGAIMITGTKLGSKIGSWNIRARCNIDPANNSRTLSLQGAAIKGNQFARDKMTGKRMSWRPLFDAGTEPCGNGTMTGTLTVCPLNTIAVGIDQNGNPNCQPLRFDIPIFVGGSCPDPNGLSGVSIGAGAGISCKATFPPPPPPPSRCCITDDVITRC